MSIKKNLKDGFLIFGIGTVFIVLGVGFFTLNNKISKWTETTGTVVDYKRDRRRASNSITFPAIIQYEVNGKTYEIEASQSSSNQPEIGSTRKVVFNPYDPNEARTTDAFSKYIPYVSIAMGISIFTYGVRWLRKIR